MKPWLYSSFLALLVFVIVYTSTHVLLVSYILMGLLTGIELVRLQTIKKRELNCDILLVYKQRKSKSWIVMVSIVILLSILFAFKKMLPELILILMPLSTAIFFNYSNITAFGLKDNLLKKNDFFQKEYNLSTLTSISFIALGDFLKLKFKTGKAVYIPRSLVENEKLQEFMTTLLQRSPQEVAISAEAKEKLSMY